MDSWKHSAQSYALKASIAAVKSETQATATKADVPVLVSRATAAPREVIATATAGDAKIRGVGAQSSAEEPAEAAIDKKKSITLSQYRGKDYLLPWDLCQTWEGRYLLSLYL